LLKLSGLTRLFGCEARAAMPDITRLCRFAREWIVVIALVTSAATMVIHGEKATMAAHRGHYECHVQVDMCVQTDEALNCIRTHDTLAQLALLGIAVLWLALSLALARPIWQCPVPEWVDPERESLDLVLCFHLNNEYHTSFFRTAKTCIRVVALLGALLLIGVGSNPATVVRENGLALPVFAYSVWNMFPYTSACDISYGTYQRIFLADMRNSDDGKLSALLLLSHHRVLDAIARQTKVDESVLIDNMTARSSMTKPLLDPRAT